MNNRTGIAGFSVVLGLQMAIMAPLVNADIVLDGTLGSSGALSGPDYVIEQTQGRTSGTNLYHSFERFNLSSIESATFTGDNSIQNIFSRVTGGSLSSIDGALNVDIPDANFYFLNPAGVIFGPNASINIDGSFNVSTADYLRFADGGRFDATHPSQSVLSVAAPSAYGFLGGDNGIIRINGDDTNSYTGLVMTNGESAMLVAPSILLDSARLKAPVGSITLAAVSGAGELQVGTNGAPPHGMNMQGDITLRNNSFVDVGPFSPSEDTANKANGAIYIRAGRFTMSKSYITSRNNSTEKPGIISIMVDSASMTNGALVSSMVGNDYLFRNADVNVEVSGDLYLSDLDDSSSPDAPIARESGFYAGKDTASNGGNIIIQADNIYTNGGHFVNIGGNTTIVANNTISLSDEPLTNNPVTYPFEIKRIPYMSGRNVGNSIYARNTHPNYALNTNNINVRSKNIIMDHASIYSENYNRTKTKSGNVTVVAENSLLLQHSRITTNGQANGVPGVVSIQASLLDMANSSKISAESSAPTLIFFPSPTDGSELINITSGYSEAPSTGQGGTINVNTETLRLIDGDQHNEGTGTIITSSTRGSGNAGEITINTTSLEMEGDVSIISEATYETSAAKAGSIIINADTITMVGADSESANLAAGISVTTKTTGDAGSITVNTQLLSMDNNASISADTNNDGAGGMIKITADNMRLANNAHITSVSKSRGKAGDIVVSAKNLTLSEGGFINTSAYGAGNAGAINLDVGTLSLVDEGSRIVSSLYSLGQGGNVNVNAREITLRDGAEISTTSFGAGDAGYVMLDVSKDFSLFDLGTQIVSESKGSGDGGLISIRAGQIHLNKGARISTMTYSSGDAGDITLNSENDVRLKGSQTGIYAGAQTSSAGEGGNITLIGRRLVMSDEAMIHSSSQGSGNAGQINVKTTKSIVLKDSAIKTESEFAGGGSITLLTRKLLELDNSTVSASVNNGSGDAGNIFIDPERVILTNSTIKANADSGNGGNVYIQAGVLIKDTNSVIEASSEYGVDGDVVIDAPVITTSSGDDKPTRLVKNKLIKSRCMAKRSKDSALIVRPNMRYSTVSSGKYHYASLSDVKTNNAPALRLAKGQCR